MEKKDLDRQGFDVCVCCGAPVPEGRMICPVCEKGERIIVSPKPAKKGIRDWFGSKKEKQNVHPK